MKRNENLINLSHEHHDGLVIALRIKKAIDKTEDYNTIVNYILHLWATLKNHFDQEEDNFLASKNIDQNNELIKRMLDEHQQFEQLVNKLSSKSENLKEALSDFSELLNDHIRFEERELFPYVEECLTDNELKQIGNKLEQTHQPLDKNWGPHFWD
ncbi:MAG: hemerythrin domain-containing protein [Ignavibacteriae bacterium]|nr:hemerythrin domain-containing protein [Ignavibacteriota bacterium]